MAWLYVLLADIFEIAWPFLMKWSGQFSKWAPIGITILISIPVSLLLGKAVKLLPAGTVYAAFIGVGAVGVAIVGMVFVNESSSLPRLASLALVVVGLIGLKFFG